MRTPLWLGVSIFSLFYKGIFGEYLTNTLARQPQNHFQSYPLQNTRELNHYYQYNDGKYIFPSKSKTEYGFHTEQTQTAEIEKGRPPSHSYSPTQHYFVTTNTTVFNLPKRSETRGYVNRTTLKTHHPQRSTQHLCIKCPSEKIIIARKGLDGVLIDPPKLMTCLNRDISSETYEIQTLFGPQFRFLLPHGTHSIHAKILNKFTGKHILTCTLRYQVIVQRCENFVVHDQNIKMDCDIGNIWGSECRFKCRTGYLSHSTPIVCGDRLKWEGDEPECMIRPPQISRTQLQRRKRNSCSFLRVPDNGKIACEYPNDVNSNSYQQDLQTPEGTICHVICDKYYEIPRHLEPFSTFHCENGRWNVSSQMFCAPKYFTNQ